MPKNIPIIIIVLIEFSPNLGALDSKTGQFESNPNAFIVVIAENTLGNPGSSYPEMHIDLKMCPIFDIELVRTNEYSILLVTSVVLASSLLSLVPSPASY